MREFVRPQVGHFEASVQLRLPDQEMINRTAEVFMSDEIPEILPEAGKLTEAICHIEVFPGTRGGGIGVYDIQAVNSVKVNAVVDAHGVIHVTSTVQVPVPIDHIDGHFWVYKKDKK